MITIFIILLGIIGVCFLIYNSIISSRQKVLESWADIDVQLKRRHDLIPSLIETVKGYAAHEKNLFEEITRIRSEAMQIDSKNLPQKSEIEKQLGAMLGKVLAVAESYPNIKASENFLKLQDELTNTEDEIASARRIYNDNVANFNTVLGVFPTNMIAKITHFTPYSFFQIS